jgi:hypothetical protein
VATPGANIVTLTWQAPSSNGGAAVDKYTVQTPNFGVCTQSLPEVAVSVLANRIGVVYHCPDTCLRSRSR